MLLSATFVFISATFVFISATFVFISATNVFITFFKCVFFNIYRGKKLL
jgi:hypothetical protein